MTQKKIQAVQLDITGSSQSLSDVTISASAGSDGLVFSNGSKIRLPGTTNATTPYFQSTVTNGTTSVRSFGNGTGGAEFVVINGSDPDNNHGQVLWTSSAGYGIYAFKNGTGTAQPWYLTQGVAGNASLTMQLNGDLDVSYNLSLNGAGKALRGDFSNATAANRNVIQTSTTDGATRLSVIPNGTGTVSNINIENSSSMTNSSTLTLGVNATELFINAGVRGAGTQLPLNVYSSSGAQAISIATSGALDMRTVVNLNSGLTLGTSAGTAGQVLTSQGLGGVPIWTTVTTAPAGADTQIQYNSAGAFAGSANFTWTAGTNTLTIGSGTAGALAFAGTMAVSSTGTMTTAPSSNSGGAGYAVNITGGASTAAAGAGGNVILTGGAASGTASGGGGSVRGGGSTSTTTGAGGIASLIGGAQAGAGASGAGGNALVQSGAVSGTGATGSSGNIFLNVGTSTSGTYGRINLTVGGTANIKFSVGNDGALVIGTGTTNYGTAGQVLTSNGAAAPTWSNNFVANSLVLPKTSGSGIKVDTTTPTFGWADLLGPIMLRGGAQNPTSAIFRGTIYAYQFALNDEVQLVYHMPHDWVPGTDLFLHTHWAHNNAGVTTGGITFTADITFAKGFDQEAFPAPKSISWTQNASTVQYQHMVAEQQISIAGGSATQLDSSLLEVDGLILVRLAVTNNTINGAPQPFIFTADIHYQSTGIATKNKAPNFYA